MGIPDNWPGTAEEYIAHLQSQIHGLQGEIRTLKEMVQRPCSCSGPAHVPAPPQPLPPISSFRYESSFESMNRRPPLRKPLPSERLRRHASHQQPLTQPPHPQPLPPPLSAKQCPRQPEPEPEPEPEPSTNSWRRQLPAAPAPPADPRTPSDEQPSTSDLEIVPWTTDDLKNDLSTTMVPKLSSAPRKPTKGLIDCIPSNQEQLYQQRKILGLDSCEGIYRAVADILFLRTQSDEVYQCNELWAGNIAEYLNLRAFQTSESIDNSHRIAKLSSYGALVFVGECIVAMSLGTTEASVDESMQKLLTLQRGKVCTAAHRTLQSYRRVPIRVTGEIDTLHQSIGNNSFEVFLYAGASLATLELLSRSDTGEAFRSSIDFPEQTEESPMLQLLYLPFLVWASMIIRTGNDYYKEVCDALGSKLFSHDQFKVWSEEFNKWYTRHCQTRKPLKGFGHSSPPRGMKRKCSESDQLESDQPASRQRLGDCPGAQKNSCGPPCADKQATSRDADYEEGQRATPRASGNDAEDEVLLGPKRTTGILTLNLDGDQADPSPGNRSSGTERSIPPSQGPINGCVPANGPGESSSGTVPSFGSRGVGSVYCTAPCMGMHRQSPQGPEATDCPHGNHRKVRETTCQPAEVGTSRLESVTESLNFGSGEHGGNCADGVVNPVGSVPNALTEACDAEAARSRGRNESMTATEEADRLPLNLLGSLTKDGQDCNSPNGIGDIGPDRTSPGTGRGGGFALDVLAAAAQQQNRTPSTADVAILASTACQGNGDQDDVGAGGEAPTAQTDFVESTDTTLHGSMPWPGDVVNSDMDNVFWAVYTDVCDLVDFESMGLDMLD